MERRQKFSPEFKREAVRLMTTSGKPAAVVVRGKGRRSCHVSAMINGLSTVAFVNFFVLSLVSR